MSGGLAHLRILPASDAGSILRILVANLRTDLLKMVSISTILPFRSYHRTSTVQGPGNTAVNRTLIF